QRRNNRAVAEKALDPRSKRPGYFSAACSPRSRLRRLEDFHMRWFGLVAVALLLTCGTAAAATSAGPTSSAPKNLLLNPGFEKGIPEHAWMPAAWDTFQSGLNTVFFGRDTLLHHGGRYSVSIANLSTYVPMFHNWSQSLVVGRELWGKDVVFTA